QLMEFLEAAAKPSTGLRPVQVILSTHSPNLSSKIPLQNLVLMQRQRAFSLAESETCLAPDDYRFLSRFLDVTKAGLFFAKGLLVVEGDAEAILLPSLARRLGKDLTKHGVSIINVGGVGLRRYSKILQRKDASKGEITVPTACITDMDVMPDCAPEIRGLKGVKGTVWPDIAKRRWRAEKDFGSTPGDIEKGLKEHREKRGESDGQCVRTFVADHWTLEYDLAFKGLSKEVHHAAYLAIYEEKIDDGTETKASLLKKAQKAFENIQTTHASEEARCSAIYKLFNRASKAIAAQHLIDFIDQGFENGSLDATKLRGLLPTYVVHAIEYATGGAALATTPGPAHPLMATAAPAGSTDPLEEASE
ncbi:TPA: chromosome segregation protein SMC, partial [Pseudomonas aeruginosa]|nr:chromosome segregation protein SMC [Pseudomonas aeruginosa]